MRTEREHEERAPSRERIACFSLLFGLLWLVALTTSTSSCSSSTCYKINVGCLADVVAGRVLGGEKKELERERERERERFD